MQVSEKKLRDIVNYIEEKDKERKEITEDISRIYSDADRAGMNSKVIKDLIKLRKMDAAAAKEHGNLLDQYKNLLGMS